MTPSIFFRPLPTAFLFFALLLLSACTSAPAVPTTGMNALFSADESIIADGSLDAAALLPKPETRIYSFMLDDAPTPVDEPAVASATTAHHASISIRYGDRSTEFLALDADGNLTLTAQIEWSEKTLTLFDPPMIIAYAHMKPGDERTQSLKMRILDSQTARKQREFGSATRTVRFLGSQAVRSPLGDVSALHLDSEFHADLSLADVDEKSSLWITPDLGIIADHSTEQVKVLGAIGRNHASLRALKSGD